MNTMIIVDPAGEESVKTDVVAPRLPSLAGARIGIINNSKHHADTFLNEVETLLKTRYGVDTFSHYLKANMSIPTPPAVLTQLADSCDAIVHGVAD